MRVSANGGPLEQLVSVKDDELAHAPQMLPGGESVLFTVAKATDSNRWNTAHLVLYTLQTGERKVLVEGGADGVCIHRSHRLCDRRNVVRRPIRSRSLGCDGRSCAGFAGCPSGECRADWRSPFQLLGLRIRDLHSWPCLDLTWATGPRADRPQWRCRAAPASRSGPPMGMNCSSRHPVSCAWSASRHSRRSRSAILYRFRADSWWARAQAPVLDHTTSPEMGNDSLAWLLRARRRPELAPPQGSRLS